MNAGVVTYAIVDGRLAEGTWTHASIGYRRARETLQKAQPGVAGSYDVSIYRPDARLWYLGVLTVTKEEEAYHLAWSGAFADGAAARFEGVGLVVSEQVFAASFEMVP